MAEDNVTPSGPQEAAPRTRTPEELMDALDANPQLGELMEACARLTNEQLHLVRAVVKSHVATRKSSKAKPRFGVQLLESEAGCGYTSLDVVNGLHGVCVALDDAIVNASDHSNAEYLAQAVKVLSNLVQDRVHN